MSSTALGTFEVELTTGISELEGAVERFELSKHFVGDLEGTSVGIMLAGGDPQGGEAGYVAIEFVRGRLGSRQGSFAMQQFGTMSGGSQTLYYEIVPGSGGGELIGISGVLDLTIDETGLHSYELKYDL